MLSRWSLQQKLFARNDTHSQLAYGTDVYSDQQNTLIATATGPNQTVAYLFKTFGNGWSLQSQLISYNVTTDGTHYDGNYLTPRPPVTNFSNPTIWGGTLFFSAGNEVQIRTQYRYGSCLLFTLSDHYLDGWDTAVLTVRAPDLTNDTFHPHCDQVSTNFTLFSNHVVMIVFIWFLTRSILSKCDIVHTSQLMKESILSKSLQRLQQDSFGKSLGLSLSKVPKKPSMETFPPN
jgi:hypothetical protein